VARPARARSDTKDRLVAAATTLFAERGFHGTTVRDIAELADANVAAGNYHYGSKKALYLEVLRAQFAAVRALLDLRGANPPADLTQLDRPALVGILRTRVRVMLEMLLGPPPGVHGTLMQREMVDPSEAMPVIVAEFIRPMFEEMYDIVAHLAPSLDRRSVERCVHSIIGQGLFYRFTRPALLEMLAIDEYPRTLADELTDHITDFSLGGLEALAARRARGRRAR
jgi:TetR/AcrR family transcriptional regulator, regulator of cefoperazone and chloramphenicol sensitivity